MTARKQTGMISCDALTFNMTQLMNMEPHLCSEVGPNHSIAILQAYSKLLLAIL